MIQQQSTNISIMVKGPEIDKSFQIKFDDKEIDTVLKLKLLIKNYVDRQPDEMKLVLKGRILTDNQKTKDIPFASYKTLHAVFKSRYVYKKRFPDPEPEVEQSPICEDMKGIGGFHGKADLNQLATLSREQISETISSISPEVMKQIIAKNPMLRQMIKKNPQLGQLLSDPESLQQMLSPQMVRTALNQIFGLEEDGDNREGFFGIPKKQQSDK